MLLKHVAGVFALRVLCVCAYPEARLPVSQIRNASY